MVSPSGVRGRELCACFPKRSPFSPYFDPISQLWSRISQELSIKSKIKNHFYRCYDLLFCLVPVGRPIVPLHLPNQRYTRPALDTGFFVARQRNFSPGGGRDLGVKRVPFIRTEGQGWPLKDKYYKWVVVTIFARLDSRLVLKGLIIRAVLHLQDVIAISEGLRAQSPFWLF